MRSGILYDNRIYETDGERAIGIHDIGSIALLPPIGTPPSLRAFDVLVDAQGEDRLNYAFLNSARIIGPNGQAPLPDLADGLDFESRLAIVVSDDGERVDAVEAGSFVLGYLLVTVLVDAEAYAEERRLGIAPGRSKDIAIAVGPFLSTPEELQETQQPLASGAKWPYRMRAGGVLVAEGVHEPRVGFSSMLETASRLAPVRAGEILAGTRLDKPPLIESRLGRYLEPGDRVEVEVEGLGVLVTNIG